jgi:hypothetical protein
MMDPIPLDAQVAKWMVELVLWHRGVESIVDICGECNRLKVCVARHGHTAQGDWVELDIKSDCAMPDLPTAAELYTMLTTAKKHRFCGWDGSGFGDSI